jgi:hypothetical protein
MFLAKRFISRTAALRMKSVNSLTLVGIVHDVQTGYVYEDPVTQFTLTTTAVDATGRAASSDGNTVVEKDHHTVRCFGDAYSQEVRGLLREGQIVCVSGRLRLNPQLEPSCNKHFYFPYVHVEGPMGKVAVIHGERKKLVPVSATTNTTSDDSAPAEAEDSQ